MKQAERMIDASLLVNHMSYQSGMSRAFKSAAKVFQDVIDSYDGPVRAPSAKELKSFPHNNLDEFDYVFEVDRITFVGFCDIVSEDIYNILEDEINKDGNQSANFEDYNKWCDFVNHFNEKKFSKLLQKILLTSKAVSYFERDGELFFEIGSGENLFSFATDYASGFLRGCVYEK